MSQPPAKQTKVWPMIEPFVLGGLSGMMATVCIQPIDMIKVRIQLVGEGGKVGNANPIALARQMIAQDGFGSLYKGLSAGLLRQATYTTARMGIFRTTSEMLTVPGEPLPFWKKTVAGFVAGGLGAVIGTPADVALIRMQADGTLPVDQRRNYKNVADALIRILREEGVQGMFKGNVPVVARAMALNAGMLASHDQAMESFKQYTSNPILASFGAKAVSGFCASAFSLPIDLVKTRIQKQKPLADGTLPYRNMMHCFKRIAAEEGVGSFYRGFLTYYVRIAPHVMITLVCLDQLTLLSKKYLH